MAEQRFEEVMRSERERLNAERAAIVGEQKALDDKLDALAREMAAIDAYEAAKSGKGAAATRPRTAPARGKRGPRGTGKRDEILNYVRGAGAEGMSRADLIARLNGRDDPRVGTAVSNALAALKRDGRLTSGARGRYVAA